MTKGRRRWLLALGWLGYAIAVSAGLALLAAFGLFFAARGEEAVLARVVFGGLSTLSTLGAWLGVLAHAPVRAYDRLIPPRVPVWRSVPDGFVDLTIPLATDDPGSTCTPDPVPPGPERRIAP